jgi:hypothetical protein
MDHYRFDNTDGYTQAELDALNAELAGLLDDLAASTDGNPDPDDVQALIKRHNDDVARR